MGIPEALLYARVEGRRLPTTLNFLLQALCVYSSKGGDAQPSQETLAADTGLARGTVCDGIKKLRALGYIESTVRDDLEGFHLRYHLTGADVGWMPRPPVEAQPFDSLACEVVEELREEVKDLEDAQRELVEKLVSFDPTFSLPPKRQQGAAQR